MTTSYEDRHYPLRSGQWHAEIHLLQCHGATITTTRVLPGAGAGIFDTEEEARAYNRALYDSALARL
jgi:hypothetical protein